MENRKTSVRGEEAHHCFGHSAKQEEWAGSRHNENVVGGEAKECCDATTSSSDVSLVRQMGVEQRMQKMQKTNA